jgi:anti-sigma-K factor RskA
MRTLFPWIGICCVAAAVCLMALVIYQAGQLKDLRRQILSMQAQIDVFRQSNSLGGLHLAALDAKDPAYSSSRVLVAWDPNLHRGVVSMQNLFAPTPGHDYQLWVLDPGEAVPVDAGLIVWSGKSQHFVTHPLTTTTPGFAVSLEPTGGSRLPTGEILFAVAPAE